jgi:amino acid permease
MVDLSRFIYFLSIESVLSIKEWVSVSVRHMRFCDAFRRFDRSPSAIAYNSTMMLAAVLA